MPEQLQALRALPAEKLTQAVGLLRHDAAAATPRIIGFANNHSIHHRGQLAAYLRAMGSKVPTIYGGSADEPMRRVAAPRPMSFPDLRAFLDAAPAATATLVTVDAPVDPHLEVAEIHRRVIAAGGPALLFTNVKGADFRLVTNLFGTARRAELAFGERPLRLIRRLVELAETLLPPTPAKLWGARDVGLRAAQGRHAARAERAR